MTPRSPGDPLPKELIREIRSRNGLSQDDLARRLGLKGGKSVISGWENGHTTCEGPAAELLLLLFGEGRGPPALVALQREMESRWRRAGNHLTSWRQVAAIPTKPFAFGTRSFAGLFPGVAIPATERVHRFPFVDDGLPAGVYGLSERWVGTIPAESERPPGYLWMLDRHGAFAYREHIWEEEPRSVTAGHTHVGSVLELSLALTFFLGRLLKEAPTDARSSSFQLQIDLEGMSKRGIVAYRPERPTGVGGWPDLALDEPPRLAPESRLSATITVTAKVLEGNPLAAGMELAAALLQLLRPELATTASIEEQLRRRHFEDTRSPGVRFLGFLDEALGRKPRKGVVSLSGRRVGLLEETANGSRFTYDQDYLRSAGAVPLSPTIPLSKTPYESLGLHPFFSNSLPEGTRLDQASRNRKLGKADRFGVLLALGEEMIGAVEVRPLEGEAR